MSRQKLGKLTLWRNVFRKEVDFETGEVLNQPHYRGKANWGNEQVDISLWVNEEAGGVVLHMSGEIFVPENH